MGIGLTSIRKVVLMLSQTKNPKFEIFLVGKQWKDENFFVFVNLGRKLEEI